jgi:hypothetical protein
MPWRKPTDIGSHSASDDQINDLLKLLETRPGSQVDVNSHLLGAAAQCK